MTTTVNGAARADSAAEAIDLLRDLDEDRDHPAHSEVFYAVAEHTLIDLADAAANAGDDNKVRFVDAGIEVTRGQARKLTIELRESDTDLNHCTVDLTVIDNTSQPFIPIYALRRDRHAYNACCLENISVAQTHVLLRRFLLGDHFRFKSHGRAVHFGWASTVGCDQQPYSLPATFLEAGLLERFILEDLDFSR